MSNQSKKWLGSKDEFWKDEDDYMGYSSKYKSSGASKYVRCYHSHQPYEVAPGYTIHGGSCSSPIVSNADVYIGFDSGMKINTTYPWEKKDLPEQVFYRIVDMSVPKDLPNFKKLVEWTAEQLALGKLVHAGCIGGHGRTGLFFAALHKHMTGNEDAIVHVRENYCKKVVESSEQVDWLHEHYGIKKAPATKSFKKYGQSDLGLIGGSKKTSYSSLSPVSTGPAQNPKGSIWAFPST